MTGNGRRRALLAVVSLVFAQWLLAGCGGGIGQSGSQVAVLVYSNRTLTNAQWVAFQDGAGAWTRLQPTSVGRYSGTVTSADHRYSVAIVTTDYGIPYVNVYRATTTELPTVVLNHIVIPSTGPVVSGSETGYTPGDEISVSVGLGTLHSSVDATYSCSPSVRGVTDFLLDYGDGNGAVYKYILDRGINITGDYTRNIDFSAAYAVSPTTFAITSTGPQLATVYTNYSLLTSNGSSLSEGVYQSSGTGYALPVALRNSGDVYTARGSTWTTSGLDYTINAASQSFTSPADHTITLPSSLVATVSELASTPYVRYQAAYTAWPNASGYSLSAYGNTVFWRVDATPGWLGSALTLDMPDLTGVTGWDTAWSAVQDGVWSIGAVHTSEAYKDYLPQEKYSTFPAGTTIQTSWINHNVD